jgi:hypothetical protein
MAMFFIFSIAFWVFEAMLSLQVVYMFAVSNSVLCGPCVQAFTAATLTVLASHEVLTSQWMAFGAMGHFCLFCGRRSSAENVFSIGDCFQMFWVNAVAYATKMIDGKSFWNWPNKLFIAYAMNIEMLLSDPHVSIFIGHDVSLPFPALGGGIDLNLGEKALNYG